VYKYCGEILCWYSIGNSNVVLQASSTALSTASSFKLQASSFKLQAALAFSQTLHLQHTPFMGVQKFELLEETLAFSQTLHL